MFDKIEKKTLSETVMEQIANKIISGELAPHQKLPTERELALSLNVSRNKIREALSALSLIGLITIKPGDGSFVTETKSFLPEKTISWVFHEEIREIDDLYEARQLIESAVYLKSINNLNNSDLESLEKIQRELERCLSNGSPEQYNEHLEKYDTYIASKCGNLIYEKLFQTLILLRRESSLKSFSLPGSINNSFKYRNQINTAIQEKDSDSLNRSLQEFYQKSKEFYEKILTKDNA